MPRAFTLGSLVSRCQQRGDQESSDFIPASEIKGYLSTAYGELYSILVASGMRYFETEQSISTNGQAAYALPADHLATVGVDYVVNANSGLRRQLSEIMIQERNVFTGEVGASESRAWSLVGSNLVLYPKPPSGQTYVHVYVAQPQDLSSLADGATVDVVTPDGEDFLIWRCAAYMLAKEESDTTVAERNAQRALERLQEWAVLRSLNTPRRRIVENEHFFFDSADYDYWRNGGGY